MRVWIRIWFQFQKQIRIRIIVNIWYFSVFGYLHITHWNLHCYISPKPRLPPFPLLPVNLHRCLRHHHHLDPLPLSLLSSNTSDLSIFHVIADIPSSPSLSTLYSAPAPEQPFLWPLPLRLRLKVGLSFCGRGFLHQLQSWFTYWKIGIRWSLDP